MFKRKPTNSIGSKKRIGAPSKPASQGSVKLKTDKQLKLTKAMKNKSISEKRNPTHSGEVYFVHPSHLIPKDKMKNYVHKKGNANPRPVAVVKTEKDSTAKIAQIYGTHGNKKNITQQRRVRLPRTNMKKNSWIGTDEKEISEKTKRKFKVGASPLTIKKGRINPTDMKNRNKISQRLKQKRPSK